MLYTKYTQPSSLYFNKNTEKCQGYTRQAQEINGHLKQYLRYYNQEKLHLRITYKFSKNVAKLLTRKTIRDNV